MNDMVQQDTPLAADWREAEPGDDGMITARDLTRGTIIDFGEIDGKVFNPTDYREVRHVEPGEDSNSTAVLIVVAGGESVWVLADARIRPVPADEYQAYLDHRAEQKRRAEMSRALRTLADLLDSGLPVPYSLRVEGMLDSSASVTAGAAMFGEIDEERISENGWHTHDMEHHFGQDEKIATVCLRLWHGWRDNAS